MAKKRISMTLEESLVDRIDYEAAEKDFNRSQMIERVINDYFRNRSIDTAVVLCGDEEGRSLEEYQGRPVLEHILDHLSSQVSRVILLTGRNDLISERFAGYGDLEIEFIGEEEPQGTAAAIEKAKSSLDSTFAVLNGHVISDVNLDEMASIHREKEVAATMALTTVEDPSSYGVARLKGSRILGFEEKPSPGEEPSRLINAGTYILDPVIFEHIEHNSLEKVFENLASEGELAGYIYGGEWIDMDI